MNLYERDEEHDGENIERSATAVVASKGTVVDDVDVMVEVHTHNALFPIHMNCFCLTQENCIGKHHDRSDFLAKDRTP